MPEKKYSLAEIEEAERKAWVECGVTAGKNCFPDCINYDQKWCLLHKVVTVLKYGTLRKETRECGVV